jgi:protease I
MSGSLSGKRVAILATDGVEQVELDRPWQALRDAGATVALVSPTEGELQAFNHLDKSDKRRVDLPVNKASALDFDALVIPGGVANGDFLRGDAASVSFARDFFEQSKPVASICHGPWVLVEADVVAGRTVTSWPSLKTDLRNAGANWVDAEVIVDRGLITSRKPDDLAAFCAKVIEEFGEGPHPG